MPQTCLLWPRRFWKKDFSFRFPLSFFHHWNYKKNSWSSPSWARISCSSYNFNGEKTKVEILHWNLFFRTSWVIVKRSGVRKSPVKLQGLGRNRDFDWGWVVVDLLRPRAIEKSVRVPQARRKNVKCNLKKFRFEKKVPFWEKLGFEKTWVFEILSDSPNVAYVCHTSLRCANTLICYQPKMFQTSN